MRRSTRYRKQEKHHCNTVWLGVPVPDKLVRLPKFFPAPHPSLEHSACLDPQSSRRKSRFFLANEGVQLIQFSLFDLGWHGSVRQLGGVLTNPIGNTLWIDLEHSSNRAKAATFHIHANCQQTGCFGITVLDWLRCIHSIAFTAAIALAS